VTATGGVRPHSFAGCGAQAISAGPGEATTIRINHARNTAPEAQAGAFDGAPGCTASAGAIRRVPTASFLLDGVAGSPDAIHAGRAGAPFDTFRAGADLARICVHVRIPSPSPRVPCPRCSDPSPRLPSPSEALSIVIVANVTPVTCLRYQRAKSSRRAPLLAGPQSLALVPDDADWSPRSPRAPLLAGPQSLALVPHGADGIPRSPRAPLLVGPQSLALVPHGADWIPRSPRAPLLAGPQSLALVSHRADWIPRSPRALLLAGAHSLALVPDDADWIPRNPRAPLLAGAQSLALIPDGADWIPRSPRVPGCQGEPLSLTARCAGGLVPHPSRLRFEGAT
jgi:hypothetical protein